MVVINAMNKNNIACNLLTFEWLKDQHLSGKKESKGTSINMPQTSKKLTGHIGFGLSVRSSKTVHARVLKFHIWIPHGKIADTLFFFFSRLSPFLWKTPWNLMHAISYEPRMLGFWNFIYGFLMEKKLTCNFFLVRVISLSGVMPLWKIQNEIFSARYFEQCLS